MDTRPCRGCALLAAMQAAPQHPQTIIYQPREPRNEGAEDASAKRSQRSGDTPFGTLRSAGFSLQALGLRTRGGCAGDEGLTPEGLRDPLRLDMAGVPFVRHTSGVGVARDFVSPQSRSFTESR